LSQLSISNPEILCLQARALTWESEFSADRAAVEPMLDRSQDLLERTALEGHDVSKELAFLQLQRGLTTFRRDYTVARRMFENALVRYRVTGISWGEAEALEGIGSCYLFIGEHDRAVELFRMCLIIQKKIGNSLGAAELLGELGLIAKHQGRLKEAEDYHSESLRLFRELGHQLREIHMAGTLAYTLDWSGKFEPAEQIARKGLAAAIRTERVIYSLLTGSNKSWPESPSRAMQELRGCFVTGMTRYRDDSLPS
jgi:tetratricopeptide (TPR) repeat protein